jgi:O-acetyl-ADP-ribose deacetylase (regulator of RNase III)
VTPAAELVVGPHRLLLLQGDITRLGVDAIVNAANERLAGGGGVDGAIHAAAGPSLAEECRRIRQERGGCPTGQAVATGAGDLPARHVIHTVGPIWRGGGQGEPELLRSCYKNSLELARSLDLESVAFPAISTGVYGYPRREAAEIAVEATLEFLRGEPPSWQVWHVLFDAGSLELWEAALRARA